MNLEKTFRFNELFDLYEPLLTEKQREVFQLYYHDDLSYQEIAEHLEISRAGVYDNLSRTLKLIEEYEEKLGLLGLVNDLRGLNVDAVNAILENYSRRKL